MEKNFSRLILGLSLALVTMLLGLVAVGFFCVALYLGLREYLTPALAALLTALTVTAIAVVLAVFGRALVRRPKLAHNKQAPSGGEAWGADVGAVVGAELANWARSHPRGVTVMALGAGFALGMCPRLRHRLLRMLN